MKKILIVEDDKVNAFVLEKHLSKFRVLKAENASTALELFEKETPDLVLMDINLGAESIDGVETMKKMKSNRRLCDTPVIAVTCYALDEEVEGFLKAGFDAFLAKPVRKDDLIRSVESNIAKKAKP